MGVVARIQQLEDRTLAAVVDRREGFAVEVVEEFERYWKRLWQAADPLIE